MGILTQHSVLRSSLAPGATGTGPLLLDVMNDGEAPKPSLDEAFKRAVFAKYPTVAS